MPTTTATTDHSATGSARFVTDGGMETDLIFHHGVDLPEFAAYPLLRQEPGRALLAQYYDGYAAIARAAGVGLVLESPTWRANPDWGARLGHDQSTLDVVNADAIRFLSTLRATYQDLGEVIICGTIGPRGDGYAPSAGVHPEEAAAYHRPQIEALASAGADRVSAYTLTDPGEAIGIVTAAGACGIPVGISFTVETNGHLPGGGALGSALDAVLAAGPDTSLLLNCAHPTHLARALSSVDEPVRRRIVGLRVNASPKSHAELDEASELDEGDVSDLVHSHGELAALLPELQIVGGCCGTDHRHVAALWGVEGGSSHRP